MPTSATSAPSQVVTTSPLALPQLSLTNQLHKYTGSKANMTLKRPPLGMFPRHLIKLLNSVTPPGAYKNALVARNLRNDNKNAIKKSHTKREFEKEDFKVKLSLEEIAATADGNYKTVDQLGRDFAKVASKLEELKKDLEKNRIENETFTEIVQCQQQPRVRQDPNEQNLPAKSTSLAKRVLGLFHIDIAAKARVSNQKVLEDSANNIKYFEKAISRQEPQLTEAYEAVCNANEDLVKQNNLLLKSLGVSENGEIPNVSASVLETINGIKKMNEAASVRLREIEARFSELRGSLHNETQFAIHNRRAITNQLEQDSPDPNSEVQGPSSDERPTPSQAFPTQRASNSLNPNSGDRASGLRRSFTFSPDFDAMNRNTVLSLEELKQAGDFLTARLRLLDNRQLNLTNSGSSTVYASQPSNASSTNLEDLISHRPSGETSRA